MQLPKNGLKISVIIPTYNRSKTIKYCLESVLAQTFSPFEIIVIDDHSTDDTMEVVRTYSDIRIRSIVLEKNSGAQVARNRGIKEAKGDWIAFQDSDDAWVPERLEKQVKELAKYDFDPWIVIHSNCYRYYPETGFKEVWELPEIEGENVYPILLSKTGPLFPALLVSKLALEKIGYLDEKVPSFQEWDTSISLARFCRFIHLKDPLFIYYLHPGETISKSKQRDLDGYQYILNKYEEDIKKICGFDIWYQHHFIQLQKCLEFQLWDEAKYYFQNLAGNTSLRMKIYKFCWTFHIKPSLVFMVINIIKKSFNILLLIIKKTIPKPIKSYLKNIIKKESC